MAISKIPAGDKIICQKAAASVNIQNSKALAAYDKCGLSVADKIAITGFTC
jgi:hypothetical protein